MRKGEERAERNYYASWLYSYVKEHYYLHLLKIEIVSASP